MIGELPPKRFRILRTHLVKQEEHVSFSDKWFSNSDVSCNMLQCSSGGELRMSGWERDGGGNGGGIVRNLSIRVLKVLLYWGNMWSMLQKSMLGAISTIQPITENSKWLFNLDPETTINSLIVNHILQGNNWKITSKFWTPVDTKVWNFKCYLSSLWGSYPKIYSSCGLIAYWTKWKQRRYCYSLETWMPNIKNRVESILVFTT